MIIDINRHGTKEIFHFKNSLRNFITCYKNGTQYYLDLDSRILYNFDELDYEGLYFYYKEEDEDFLGVEIADPKPSYTPRIYSSAMYDCDDYLKQDLSDIPD